MHAKYIRIFSIQYSLSAFQACQNAKIALTKDSSESDLLGTKSYEVSMIINTY